MNFHVKIFIRVIKSKEFFMNENPGETPNPLNPSPTPSSTEVGSEQNSNITETEVVATALETVENPTAPATGTTDPVGADGEPKKKKTGLIIGIIVAAVVLIGGAVAAALLLIPKGGDRFMTAVSKLISGDSPSNVAIKGSVEVKLNDKSTPINKIIVDLNSELKTDSMVGSSSSVFTIQAKYGEYSKNYSTTISEIHTSEKNLYVKVDNIDSILNFVMSSMNSNTLTTTNCVDDETGETNCMDDDTEYPIEYDCTNDAGCAIEGSTVTSDILAESGLDQVIELIDDKWLKISLDEAESLIGQTVSNDSVNCLTEFAGDVKKNKDSLTELYNKNPFLSSDSEKDTIASKNFPVYKVNIDDELLVGYLNSLADSTVIKNLSSCLGSTDEIEIDEDEVSELVNKLPDIYVEIDDDDNFSRFYTSAKVEGSPAEIVVDLSFAYPTAINVTEPDKYTDVMTLLQQLYSNAY